MSSYHSPPGGRQVNRPARGSTISRHAPRRSRHSSGRSSRPSPISRQPRVGPRLVPVELADARRRSPASAAPGRSARPRASAAASGPSRVSSASPISSAWPKPARVSGVCSASPCIRRGGVEHGLAVAGDEEAAHRARRAGESGGVDRGRRAAQSVGGRGPGRRSRRVSRRPGRCRCASRPGSRLVGAAVRRPGVAAAAGELEGSARRSGAAPPSRRASSRLSRTWSWPPRRAPASGRSRRRAASPRRRRPGDRRGDRVAAAGIAERRPVAEHAERLPLRPARAAASRRQKQEDETARHRPHQSAACGPLATGNPV